MCNYIHYLRQEPIGWYEICVCCLMKLKLFIQTLTLNLCLNPCQLLRGIGTPELTHEQRKKLRLEESLPVLKEMEVWLKDQLQHTLPKSAIGKAIAYTINLWPRLIRYIDDGKAEIDNNLVENAIRPVALGRKNYLFAGSHDGAQRSAMIYSLLGTCKLNNVEPWAWLKDVLTRLPDHSIQRLEELLPQNFKSAPIINT